MTATERAKRSDALYYETVSVTRRVLCDMIANREADLEDAREENAKLRELLEAVLQCAGETKRDKGCDACPMYNGPWRNDGTWCLLRPTLRELGVVE